jgi:hypothetical protein
MMHRSPLGRSRPPGTMLNHVDFVLREGWRRPAAEVWIPCLLLCSLEGQHAARECSVAEVSR